MSGCHTEVVHPYFQPHLLPAAFHRPSGAIVTSPEFARRDLLEMFLRTRPDLAKTLLPFNASLPEDIWMALYSFKPKPSLLQALALTSHPLNENQLQHLRREKRAQVWAHVMTTTLLEPEFITFLAKTNRLDSRIKLQRQSGGPLMIRATKVLTRLTDETARSWPAFMIRNMSHCGAAVNYLLEKVETPEAWEVLLGIVDDFEGSISDLVEVSLNLSKGS